MRLTRYHGHAPRTVYNREALCICRHGITAAMINPVISDGSRKTSLILDAPPVVEAGIQLQFSDIPHWSVLHPGLLYQQVRGRFHHFRELPEMPPVLEFFPAQNRRLQLQLVSPGAPGCCQFENDTRECLIRVQRNRFSYHWADGPTHERRGYPSFPENFLSFESEFGAFEEFCRTQNLSSPEPMMAEVVYVNHLHPVDGESLANLTKRIFGVDVGDCELVTLNRTYTRGNEGRLYSEINVNLEENRPFLVYQLTSRIILGQTASTWRMAIELAHDWLIETFVNSTSEIVRRDEWKQHVG
jgi:uncharacterized protein (TIGR04255 family)